MPSLLELQRAVAREFDLPSQAVASSFIVSDGIDAAHRLGLQPQPLVGDDEDVALGHCRDVRVANSGVNAGFALEIWALSPYRSPFVHAGAESR